MKRYIVLLLFVIAMAMQSVTFATENKINNKNANTEKKSYVKGQKEMSFKAAEVPQEIKAKLKDMILESSDGSNEYYVLLPANHVEADAGELGIFICSGNYKNTQIVVERGDYGITHERIIADPYDVICISAAGSSKNAILYPPLHGAEVLYAYPSEYSEDNITTDKGFRIYTLPDPITGIYPEIFVYSGSFRYQTADGYMALPTVALGNSYIHCAQTDNDENGLKNEAYQQLTWRTGFSCIATLDNTQIRYYLKAGFHYCISFGKKQVNQSFPYTSPIMKRGDVWSVCNGINSTQNMACDFTGTIVESDKNFAFISWCQRTGVPVTSRTYTGGLSRDNLCEQLLPTSKWGKTHISVQFLGEHTKNSKWKGSWRNENPGNLFRVVAKEPNTTSRATYCDLLTFQVLSTWETNLKSEGSWDEYLPISNSYGFDPDNPGSPQWSIAGACLWTADKPVQIMMYSTTQTYYWYRSGQMDPMMVIIPSVEQYGNNTTFVTAPQTSNSDFQEHFINLYAEGPTIREPNPNGIGYTVKPNLDPDSIKKTLNSLQIIENGAKIKLPYTVTSVDPGFNYQRVPNSTYYFARWQLKNNEVFHIKGRTRLSATVYGWGPAISYGWPTSMKLVVTNAFDNEYPRVRDTIVCGVPSRLYSNGLWNVGTTILDAHVLFRVWWADTINRDESDWEDKQVDLGLNREPSILYDETENLAPYRYNFINPYRTPSSSWQAGTFFLEGYVDYKTLDPYKDVFAIVMFEDAAGNTEYDTLIYIADKLEFFNTKGNLKTEIDFGEAIANQTYHDTTIVRNMNTDKSVITNIEEIFLFQGGSGVFSITKVEQNGQIVSTDDYSSIEIEAGEEIMIVVTYSPKNQGSAKDRLVIYTQCLGFNLFIYAGAGFPRIHVTDINFGQVRVNNAIGQNKTLRITNRGNMDLIIRGYEFKQSKGNIEQHPTDGPFVYEPYPSFSLPTQTNPLIIREGRDTVISYFYFFPKTRGYDSVELHFLSNAVEELDPDFKGHSLLEGEGVESEPLVTPYDWERRRVKTINSGSVTLTNSGNMPVEIREFRGVGWSLNASGDTLFSNGKHYYIPNYQQYIGKVVQPLDDDNPNANQSLDIAVFFNPQSEYPHLVDGIIEGDCPREEYFYINFTSASYTTDNACTCYLKGVAFLPKIEPNGYTWAKPTKELTTSTDTGEVAIYNTSFTSPLKIKKMTLLPIGQYQDFELGAGLMDPTSYNWPNIPEANNENKDSIVIPIAFRPLNTTPAARRAYVEIQSDAKDGSGMNGTDVNPTKIDTVELIANAFDEGLLLGNIDYGDITRCDDPIKQLLIKNQSTTNVLEVYDIEIPAPYDELFKIASNLPDVLEIAPGGQENVSFRFVACDWVDEEGHRLEGLLKIPVIVSTNMGTETTEFRATPMIIPLRLTLPTIPNTVPGSDVRIPINIQLQNDDINFYSFENARITKFVLEFITDRSALYFEGNKYDPVDNNSWDFSIVQDQNGLVKITGTARNNAYVKPGNFCIPIAKLLLSPLTEIPMKIVSFYVEDRECCISYDERAGSVTSTFCAQDLRGGINITGTPYLLPPVSPNPYTSNTLEFDYDIGLDGEATIEIYNSNGELVKSVLNNYVKVGKYTAKTDISNFSSGAYTIILKAGQFEETQKLIIVK